MSSLIDPNYRPTLDQNDSFQNDEPHQQRLNPNQIYPNGSQQYQQHFQQPGQLNIPQQHYIQVNNQVSESNGLPLLYESKVRFSNPSTYNDIFWAIFFYLHLFIIFIVAIVLGAKYHSNISPNTPTISFNIDSHLYAYGFSSLAIGLINALFWILLIRKFARFVVWVCVFLSAVALLVVSIDMFANKSTVAGVMFFILFALNCVYIYYIRNSIEFSVVLIETAVEYINQCPASIYTGLGFLGVLAVFVIIWFFAFIFTVAAFYDDYNKCVSQKSGNSNNCTYDALNISLFFFSISLYWGIAVIMNVLHTTVAGSFVSWYFLYPNQSEENPTWKSMIRALTTSFGSICFGSFIFAIVKFIIVAFIKTIKSTLLSASRSNGSCISSCAYCLISYFDSILNLFNTYTYTYIAIYGLSFCKAGNEVYNLMNAHGLDTIVNEDITLTVLNCGAVFGGFITGILGFGLASGYSADTSEKTIPIFLVYLLVY